MQSTRISSSLLAVTLLGACGADSLSYVQPTIGDTWTLKEGNVNGTEDPTFISTKYVVSARDSGGNTTMELVNADTNAKIGSLTFNSVGELMLFAGTDGVCAYEPPSQRFQFPMDVGDAWDFAFTLNCGGDSSTVSGSVDVVGRETLSTDFGALDVLKLDIKQQQQFTAGVFSLETTSYVSTKYALEVKNDGSWTSTSDPPSTGTSSLDMVSFTAAK